MLPRHCGCCASGGCALYRSLAPEATYRYVNTAQWESAQACQEAHDQGFRELAGALAQREATRRRTSTSSCTRAPRSVDPLLDGPRRLLQGAARLPLCALES